MDFAFLFKNYELFFGGVSLTGVVVLYFLFKDIYKKFNALDRQNELQREYCQQRKDELNKFQADQKTDINEMFKNVWEEIKGLRADIKEILKAVYSKGE